MRGGSVDPVDYSYSGGSYARVQAGADQALEAERRAAALVTVARNARSRADLALLADALGLDDELDTALAARVHTA